MVEFCPLTVLADNNRPIFMSHCHMPNMFIRWCSAQEMKIRYDEIVARPIYVILFNKQKESCHNRSWRRLLLPCCLCLIHYKQLINWFLQHFHKQHFRIAITVFVEQRSVSDFTNIQHFFCPFHFPGIHSHQTITMQHSQNIVQYFSGN